MLACPILGQVRRANHSHAHLSTFTSVHYCYWSLSFSVFILGHHRTLKRAQEQGSENPAHFPAPPLGFLWPHLRHAISSYLCSPQFKTRITVSVPFCSMFWNLLTECPISIMHFFNHVIILEHLLKCLMLSQSQACKKICSWLGQNSIWKCKTSSLGHRKPVTALLCFIGSNY